MKNTYTHLLEKRCATFAELQESDRQFFLQNPTAKSFQRPHFAGEFWGFNERAESVLVTQIEVGMRVRLPIFAIKKKRRSPKGKVKGFRVMR